MDPEAGMTAEAAASVTAIHRESWHWDLRFRKRTVWHKLAT